MHGDDRVQLCHYSSFTSFKYLECPQTSFPKAATGLACLLIQVFQIGEKLDASSFYVYSSIIATIVTEKTTLNGDVPFPGRTLRVPLCMPFHWQNFVIVVLQSSSRFFFFN